MPFGANLRPILKVMAVEFAEDWLFTLLFILLRLLNDFFRFVFSGMILKNSVLLMLALSFKFLTRDSFTRMLSSNIPILGF